MSVARKSGGWGYLMALFGTLAALIAGINLFERTQSGEGTRSGVVVKLSYKGRLNKSWEGQLMLGGVHSGATWDFSLDPQNPTSGRLAEMLQAAELSSTPLTLRYKQYFIGPWKTDTNYLVATIVQVPVEAVSANANK